MSSVFSGLSISARSAHDYFFAVLVTLVEPGAAARDVRAVVGKSRTETRATDLGQQRVTVRDCRFIDVESVRHDATISVDGMDWSIEDITDRSASGIECVLRRIEAYDVSRPSYRGKG